MAATRCLESSLMIPIGSSCEPRKGSASTSFSRRLAFGANGTCLKLAPHCGVSVFRFTARTAGLEKAPFKTTLAEPVASGCEKCCPAIGARTITAARYGIALAPIIGRAAAAASLASFLLCARLQPTSQHRPPYFVALTSALSTSTVARTTLFWEAVVEAAVADHGNIKDVNVGSNAALTSHIPPAFL